MSAKTEEKLPPYAGVLTLLLVGPVLLLNGWVLSVLWRWFVVPTFGLPTLSLPAAVGIVLIVAFLRPPPPKSEIPWSEVLFRQMVLPIAGAVLVLFIGLIVKGFM